jgi:hypothetical protein
MRTIKLMADYECHPLWELTEGGQGDLDPRLLPISQELQGSLSEWAARYDETLNQSDPVRSGFSTPQKEADFKEDGIRLAKRLQVELGSNFTVIYKSLK